MALIVKATITEMGAMYPVLENLHNISQAKPYGQAVRMLTNFLLSLYKLRGGKLTSDATGYKFVYVTSYYAVETKEYMMEFRLESDFDRRMKHDPASNEFGD